MMEEVAYTFHFQPSELKAMRIGELINWHNGVRRIQKKLSAAAQR